MVAYVSRAPKSHEELLHLEATNPLRHDRGTDRLDRYGVIDRLPTNLSCRAMASCLNEEPGGIEEKLKHSMA